jgi:hypothetical protein
VLVVGYNPNDENDMTIFDPLGGKLRSLKDYLGWFKPSARNTIEKYLIYEGPAPQAGGNTVAVAADVFPNLVHGSGEWDATVAEYLPTNDPKKTAFADVQRVVNGFKSDATQSKNKAAEVQALLDAATTEIVNQKDKVANTEAACQRAIELKQAEIIALKQAQPNIDKLVTQYTSTISGLEDALKEAKKQGGLKDLKITELQSKINQLELGVKKITALEKLIKKLKSLWPKV